MSLALSLAAASFVLRAPDVPRAVSRFGSGDNKCVRRAEYAFHVTCHAPAAAAAAISPAVPGVVPTAAVRATVRAVWAAVRPDVRAAAAVRG